ncbi:MAG: hypothetical protein IPK68_05035 [Bdellovibrionales bacterium]|nr:hypothetical protein [Bdellovibrionales bacterium]
MDLLEKIFQKYWTSPSQRQRRRSSTVEFSKQEAYLKTVAQVILGTSEPVQLIPARTFVGFAGGHLFLPEWVGHFSDAALNRKAYLYLVLKSCASKRLDLVSKKKAISPLGGRIDFLSRSNEVNIFLDNQFPGFASFENEFISDLLKECPDYKLTQFQDLYLYWRLALTSRTPHPPFPYKKKESFRINEVVPAFVMMTVPFLCQGFSTASIEVDENQSGDSHRPKGTEKEKATIDPTENISLEEQKKNANPVSHSFEKIKTLDDYQGGYQVDSGDDEIESHANALEELELNQVTLGGETAKSVYKADSILLFQRQSIKTGLSGVPNERIYREWSHRSGRYLENHCRIHLNRIPVGPSDDQLFQTRIKEGRQSKLQEWRRLIQSVVNEPLWQRRQKDGAELDEDAVIRYLVNLQTKSADDGRFYATKRKLMSDVSVLILFDQSLSTDSWIGDSRVLDIILESIGLAGLLFEEIIRDVMVAGTWSATCHHCDYHVYKDFESSWQNFYQVGKSIMPQGYTRLGPSIRHSIEILRLKSSRKKILLILTDGKPTDLDHYEGPHGLNDVRKACLEAEEIGIFPYALTIDKKEKNYFSLMFKRYAVMPSADTFADQLLRLLLAALK